MGGREEGCRSWEEDQLALPKTFSDNIKKKLPESVTLKGPGGVLWNIELTTRDGTLYFTNGWQQFVKEHSLKENDLLVFKYNGESLFEVLIFDGESLCEKASCYFVRKCRHAATTEHGGGCSSKKKDSDNSVEEVNTPSNDVDEGVSPEKSLHLNKIRVPFAVPIETTNGKTSNAGLESASAEQFMSDAVADTEAITVPSQTTGKRMRKPVYADMSVPSKRRGRPPKSANSHERALDWVSDAELSPKASPKATCTEDTLLVTMRPSHVYKRFFVSFPNKWILNHLTPSSQDVILRMGKEGEWVGKYCYHNIRNNGGLSGGWKHFALENNLEEFDVCLFKPAGYMQNMLIIEMTIFRVVEEITPLTAVHSPGKKRSIKKTPSGEPQLKRRGVMIAPIRAVQTELDSLEGMSNFYCNS
ncbi:unnamed protein product [Vicia faba]|uniref:TF-B3 domain-containing protein n=1 Tax=Vicia faba TaxID=3906 RepID=A0AAV0YH39_VICFA|nr:unnamed protein product [Vicia faba]